MGSDKKITLEENVGLVADVEIALGLNQTVSPEDVLPKLQGLNIVKPRYAPKLHSIVGFTDKASYERNFSAHIEKKEYELNRTTRNGYFANSFARVPEPLKGLVYHAGLVVKPGLLFYD